MTNPSGSKGTEVPNDLLDPAATEDIRRSAAGWIGAADLKATAMLAAACAVPALAALTGLKPTTPLGIGALLVFFLLDTASIVSSALVLYPRTNRGKILRAKGVIHPLPHSISFFGDISALGHYQLKSMLQKDEHERLRSIDALEQTLIITWIADAKMRCIRISVVCLTLASIALVAMALLALVSTPTINITRSSSADHILRPAEVH